MMRSIFSWAWRPFVQLLWSCTFLWRNVYQSFTHFYLSCLFVVELQEFFKYFRYKSLSRYMMCKYFLPFFRLSFHFLHNILDAQKFPVMMSPIYLLSVPFAFLMSYLTFHCQIHLTSLFAGKSHEPLLIPQIKLYLNNSLCLTAENYKRVILECLLHCPY